MARHALAMLAALAGACSQSAAPPPAPRPACDALVETARRAEACDPALAELAARLEAEADETACRRAVRTLLGGSPADAEPHVRSVWTPRASPDAGPLSESERHALAELPLPAELLLVPATHPAPGIPRTSATIDRLELLPDPDGRIRGFAAPGARTIELRHAGQAAVYCVTLRECERTELSTDGTHLPRRPDVRTGPC
jgi:hypothetical protein